MKKSSLTPSEAPSKGAEEDSRRNSDVSKASNPGKSQKSEMSIRKKSDASSSAELQKPVAEIRKSSKSSDPGKSQKSEMSVRKKSDDAKSMDPGKSQKSEMSVRKNPDDAKSIDPGKSQKSEMTIVSQKSDVSGKSQKPAAEDRKLSKSSDPGKSVKPQKSEMTVISQKSDASGKSQKPAAEDRKLSKSSDPGKSQKSEMSMVRKKLDATIKPQESKAEIRKSSDPGKSQKSEMSVARKKSDATVKSQQSKAELRKTSQSSEGGKSQKPDMAANRKKSDLIGKADPKSKKKGEEEAMREVEEIGMKMSGKTSKVADPRKSEAWSPEDKKNGRRHHGSADKGTGTAETGEEEGLWTPAYSYQSDEDEWEAEETKIDLLKGTGEDKENESPEPIAEDIVGPTYQNKFRPAVVQYWMEKAMNSILKDKVYEAEEAKDLTNEIARAILKSTHKLQFPRYKLVATVMIAERSSDALVSAYRCLWDAEADCSTTYTFTNDTLYCVGSVYGVYCY